MYLTSADLCVLSTRLGAGHFACAYHSIQDGVFVKYTLIQELKKKKEESKIKTLNKLIGKERPYLLRNKCRV